ncbi:MAG: hypothetical protein PHY15_03570 [Eubacteriales bacterium]|nr:hypothetical protein [Eubacteriales bacterium]
MGETGMKKDSIRFKMTILIVCTAMICLAMIYRAVLGGDFFKNIIMQLFNH